MLYIIYLIGLISLVFGKYAELIAAVYTPFNKDLSLNTSIIEDHAKYLKKYNVTGVFVGGTTGEGYSLTLNERKELAEAWVTAGQENNLTVIIHVGADSLTEARELSIHSKSIGADGISAMSPVFFKPSNARVLVDCMKFITKDIDIPFYYYHIPPMTGVNIDIVEFFKLSVKEIPTFRGIKFSDAIINDITEIQYLMKDNSIVPDPSKISIYFGRDEAFDSALYMDVTGGVGSTYGYAPQIYQKLIESFETNHTESRLWQERSERFIRIFARYSSQNVNAHKYLCSLTTGLDFGPPRLPYVEISDENKKLLFDELRNIEYFEWVR